MNFFFYGTLMKDLEYHHLIREHVRWIKPVALSGYRMFSAGDYPAVIRGSGDDMIHGELVTIDGGKDAGKLLHIIDELEGYNPAGKPQHNLYLRKVITIAGCDEKVWMYIWNRDTENMPLVADGNWRGYKRTTDPGKN